MPKTVNTKPLIDALLFIMCDQDIQRKLGKDRTEINQMIQKAIRDYNGNINEEIA